MPTSHPFRPRRRARFAVVLVGLLLLGIAGAPAASAHHPEITGAASCDATVTFTSTAWEASTEPERTNPAIRVEYSVGGAPFVTLPQQPDYRYDAANGFLFSGVFTPPSGWSSLRLRATAEAAWGSGVGPGDSRTSGEIVPRTDCVTATIADATCADGGAVVHLTNTGDTPAVFTVTGGASPQAVTVAAGSTRDHTVALPADAPSTITVTAPGMTTVIRTVTPDCAGPLPAAVVADATCEGGGSVVRLDNTGDAPGVFTISVPGRPDTVSTVTGGQTLEVAVPLPEDAVTTLTITSPGMTTVTRDITYGCISPTEAAAADAERAAAARAAATQRVVARTAADVPGGELPRTGAGTVTTGVLALAAVLLGGALLAVTRDRTSVIPVEKFDDDR